MSMDMHGSRSLVVYSACALLACPVPAGAQPTLTELTATPEEATTLFLRSVRAIRWSATAQFVHPETLERFHTVVTMIVEADTAGTMRDFLTRASPEEYRRLDAAAVFERSIGAMIDDMPGLMHAIFDRDDDVLGHVAEASDAAHVVYRTKARLSGAVAEVKVMQLGRTPGGWRVLWSDELEVLDTALRGITRGHRVPGPA